MTAVYINYARTLLCEETGHKAEIQAFVGGKPLDDVQLTHETKEEVRDRYKQEHSKIYINGTLVYATGVFVIEDRDLAYFYLDPTGIPEAEEGTKITVNISPEVRDWEDKVVWLECRENFVYEVIPKPQNWEEFYDWCESQGKWSIPTPVVIRNKEDWEAQRYLHITRRRTRWRSPTPIRDLDQERM